ncbi:FAD/NAD(P)-binding protein [Streptomyces sp. PR69]|uniref:FAD/NAD(P)-binding protein n=1 Tax=Streptomyces sp. PR69 TaxID=2984950 RepID=UPI002263CBB6|nr:FAD/NAD(P)-binding protein [Streptomyces sp. PR69]
MKESATEPTTPLTLAVIGTGPRGISVLERLAARLADGELGDRAVRIYAVDAVEVGAGRIWRTDQDDWFTMNTVVGQVTMYSGGPDGGPARPGAGPSLGEWIKERAERHGEPERGPDDYASRRRYGQYLRSVYASIVEHLPDSVELTEVPARVTALAPRPGGGYRLTLDRSPRVLEADKVLIATGHPRLAPDAFERRMLDFAGRHPGLHYLCGDSAADMPLDKDTIPPGSTVGIRGLGLSFYDVMLSLTVGRGGGFVRDGVGNGDGHEGGGGALRYVPSGLEPKIVTGSRSGLPIPARGRNQKRPDHTHRPLFLTGQAVAEARERRFLATGDHRLDFAEDVLPLLMREVEHVYRTTHERTTDKRTTHERTTDERTGAAADPLPPLDLRALARPFQGAWFESPDAFRARLLDLMRADLAEAARGNADGPLKAALDVLRDIRNVVREAVDYGGLRPDSHADDFSGGFLPVNSLLSAGPPAERVEQLVALIEAGVVEVAGPAADFDADEAAGRFTVSSPQVAGSARTATALVDARIPTPDLRRDTSPLTRSLLADGLVAEYVRTDPGTGVADPTGGLDVTRAPFHVVDARGTIRRDLYALGIPTEHTRWFTQVGSGKPGLNTLFRQDADAIAADMLRPGAPSPSAGRVAAAAGSPA